LIIPKLLLFCTTPLKGNRQVPTQAGWKVTSTGPLKITKMHSLRYPDSRNSLGPLARPPQLLRDLMRHSQQKTLVVGEMRLMPPNSRSRRSLMVLLRYRTNAVVLAETGEEVIAPVDVEDIEVAAMVEGTGDLDLDLPIGETERTGKALEARALVVVATVAGVVTGVVVSTVGV
jgi:hypothetical protein